MAGLKLLVILLPQPPNVGITDIHPMPAELSGGPGWLALVGSSLPPGGCLWGQSRWTSCHPHEDIQSPLHSQAIYKH